MTGPRSFVLREKRSRRRTATLLGLVEADPLADIRNTKKINAVLVRGKLITAREREKIFAEVEKAAAELSPPSQPQGSCAC